MTNIKIINGTTLEVMGIVEEEHDFYAIRRLADSYVAARGKIVSEDWSSDCITIVNYTDGTTLGFSI